MFSLYATVEALSVRDRDEAPKQPRSFIEVTLEGVLGDVHAGHTRKADGRDVLVKRGTPVRNWRQWSAVSQEELAIIADNLGLPAVEPAWLSANITFSGVPSFSKLPRGTRLIFESGVILDVEEENAPCTGPGKEIGRLHRHVKPHAFVKAAMNLRGVVGVVYRAGVIKVGDRAEVVVYQP